MGRIKTRLKIKGFRLDGSDTLVELDVDRDAYEFHNLSPSRGGLFAKGKIAEQIIALIPLLDGQPALVRYSVEAGHHAVSMIMSESLKD